MQPINAAPIYANCFDRLTTHGIVAEDVMGYITGTPSPYLQNYVAQRGGAPYNFSLPGQILPETLTPMIGPRTTPQQNSQLPQGSIYNNVAPSKISPATLEPPKNKQINTIKQIAAGVLLTGLVIAGIFKGKTAISKLKTTFNNLFRSSGTSGSSISSFFNKIKQGTVNACKAVGTFFKNIWNKIFHRTPRP